MKASIAETMRFLFKFPLFRNRYYGFCKYFGFFRNVKREVKYRNGILLHLNLGDWVQQQVYFLGDYEKEEIDFLYQFLKHGDVFFDIGANFGLFSLNASKVVGNQGKVFAFEPFPANFQKFQQHISANRFQNIVLENLAVSEKNGFTEIKYDENADNLGMASVFVSEFTTTENVRTVSLDHYVKQNGITRINLIKMDIEGGEWNALLGMKEVLSTLRPAIIIEINRELLKKSGKNEKDIADYLSQFQYRQTKVMTGDSQSYNALFQAI